MLSDAELAALDSSVEETLATGDESALDILGYGEITLVVGWPHGNHIWACKRLPPFPSRERYERTAELFPRYLRALRAGGVDVVDSEPRPVERPDGSVVAYVVQPALDPLSLGPAVLARTDPSRSHEMIGEVVTTMQRVIGPEVGLDAQISNWAWDDAGLHYFDVTTPFLRDSTGRAELDVELLLAALPAVLRPPVRRFVAPEVLLRYHQLRPTVLDVGGNLLKERLDPWLGLFLHAANRTLDEPVHEAEVRRFYRRDARLWAALLGLRRADRWWTQRVRRRPYPFLLPHKISR